METGAEWTEPGAHVVSKGVFRIPLPLPLDGLKAVNVYAIESDAGLICIDGGWAVDASRRQFDQSLAAIGYSPRDIAAFLVTHAHRDHYTQASTIRSEFRRATIALGAAEKSALDAIHHAPAVNPFYSRLLVCGADALARKWAETVLGVLKDLSLWQYPDAWLTRDRDLEIGGRTLRALHTPGHTAGHFVFADTDAGLLFAGDHVLPTITPSIGFEAQPNAQPLHDFMASLAKVRSLPDMHLLPAHGPTTMRTHERVDQLVEHHQDRLGQCSAACRHETLSPYEVATRLTWTSRHRNFDQLDVFDAGLAVMEAFVHLELLHMRRDISRREVGGVFLYSSEADVHPSPECDLRCH